MSKEYFRVINIQSKIDRNINIVLLMKVCAVISVSIIPISTIVSRLLGVEPTQKNFLWFFSILLILFLFFFSVYLIKKNKGYEFELYYLELESLERKKRVAQIRNEPLSDYVQNHEVKEPNEEISFPILFYGILLIIDILAKFLIFDVI